MATAEPEARFPWPDDPSWPEHKHRGEQITWVLVAEYVNDETWPESTQRDYECPICGDAFLYIN